MGEGEGGVPMLMPHAGELTSSHPRPRRRLPDPPPRAPRPGRSPASRSAVPSSFSQGSQRISSSAPAPRCRGEFAEDPSQLLQSFAVGIRVW